MQEVVFITGNASKAEYLAKYLDHPVTHQKVELDELQSMDLKVIVEHKVRQAYGIVQKPVLVDDVALEFEGLNGLPGPFIKFFVDRVPFITICAMLNGMSRKAVARCVLGYYDGTEMQLFESGLNGSIAEQPAGDKGFGWDQLFIPEGYTITRAEMDEVDDQKTYMQIKPLAQLKAFLKQRG